MKSKYQSEDHGEENEWSSWRNWKKKESSWQHSKCIPLCQLHSFLSYLVKLLFPLLSLFALPKPHTFAQSCIHPSFIHAQVCQPKPSLRSSHSNPLSSFSLTQTLPSHPSLVLMRVRVHTLTPFPNHSSETNSSLTQLLALCFTPGLPYFHAQSTLHPTWLRISPILTTLCLCSNSAYPLLYIEK